MRALQERVFWPTRRGTAVAAGPRYEERVFWPTRQGAAMAAEPRTGRRGIGGYAARFILRRSRWRHEREHVGIRGLRRAAHWALARDRYAGVGVDVEAGRRGAGGRPDARGDGLCPLWRGGRRCRVGVGASAAPCWFVFRHWRLCRAVHTPPKPMVTRTRARRHAGPSPSRPLGARTGPLRWRGRGRGSRVVRR